MQSIYSQALLDRICDELAQGTPLTQICRRLKSEGIALAPRTVRDWEAQIEGVSDAVAAARADGEQALAEECLWIADTPLEGEETKLDKDGNVVEVKRGDMLGHRKLQIDTRLKLLAKFNPKRWGERIAQEISGPDGKPVQTVMSVEIIAVTAEQKSE
ncbi:hypothetical protein [Xanthomonas albilineans]|uniref:terminase small subunit-like protein n=1 Tax=Xanthomonas albilineans TaxID=29447 RepID=UPI0009B9C0B5|nr:hypothetical protein [Xanthomonas albilineans]